VRLNDILGLTASQRRRLRSWGKVRRLGPRVKRKAFSRDELLDYLRQGAIRSTRVLDRKRSTLDPTVFDYRKEFGSWRKAVDDAFGKGPLKPSIDARYVLRAVPYFNAWTWKRYLEARRAHPEILPSVRFILREFGKFSEFVACARWVSLEQTMESYRALWRKLGHRPLLEECRNNGVRIDFAIEFFRGKAGLDKLVGDMVESKEK